MEPPAQGEGAGSSWPLDAREAELLNELRCGIGRAGGPEAARRPSAALLTCVDERIVPDAPAAVDAATQIGFPVVLKLNGDAIAHKTERGLVRLNVGDAAAVETAATELLAAATDADGPVSRVVDVDALHIDDAACPVTDADDLAAFAGIITA